MTGYSCGSGGSRNPTAHSRAWCRPFISARFPGVGGGECSTQLFIRICIGEIWAGGGWQPVGDIFTAFAETAEWVFDVLVRMFEEAGSTPGTHWSDRLLAHWALLVERLEAAIAGYTHNLVPRHAWEIVRLAGLPLPSALVDGNPFLERPEILPDNDRLRFAQLWADIVGSFVLRDGGVAELLSASDRQGPGPTRPCAWRDLGWGAIQGLPLDTPAPVVGTVVFGNPPSPSLISQDIPSMTVVTVPSWWGVSTDALEGARRRLRQQTPLVPDVSQGLLLQPSGANANWFVLNTRQGTVSHAHTAAKWRVRVSITGVILRFKEDWNALHVSLLEPASAVDGDAWINPDTATIAPKGATVSGVNLQVTAGEQLLLTFSFVLEYSGSRNRQTGAVTGSWATERSLVVSVGISSRFEGRWERARTVESELAVIVPSPYSPTVLVADGGKLVAAGPDTQDKFTADASSASWEAETTPTLLLDEEGRYDVIVYDGTVRHDTPSFRSVVDAWVSDTQLPAATGAIFPPSAARPR